MIRCSWRAAVLFVGAAVAGCGGGATGPGLQGTVSLQGKPLAGVTVALVPEAGGATGRLIGSTDPQGKIVLAPADTGGKVISGTYKVVVTDPAAGRSAAAAARKDDPYSTDQKPGATANPPIPVKFADAATTTATVKVEDGKPVTIDLTP